MIAAPGDTMKFDKAYLHAFLYGNNWDQMTAVKHFEQTELIPTWEKLTEATPSVYHGDTRLCQAHCVPKITEYLDKLPFRRLRKEFKVIEVKSGVYCVSDCYNVAYGQDKEGLRLEIENVLNAQLVELDYELQYWLFGDIAYTHGQDHSKAAALAFWPNLHMRRTQTQLEYYLWLQAFCIWPQPSADTSEPTPVPERT
jgi:hypothetical protein